MSGRLTTSAAAYDSGLHAESGLRAKLERLDAGGLREGAAHGDEGEQQRADELLARIAWSRIAEPGDGAAGGLLAVVGARGALEMLVRGARPAEIVSRVRAACSGDGVVLDLKTVKSALKRWMPRLDRGETLRDVENALAAGLRVVLPGDPHWPAGLADLGPHEPALLWLRGDPAHLRSPGLGVVGARAATGYGTHITAEIVQGVCDARVTIVSGAAYGIDAVAHRTALAADSPTVAVLAGGADRPYPAAHTTLLERIAGAGTVCAEMVPGAAPTRWRFLQRNRIIAALSGATLVTEAGVRSGTLNTAGHAATLGRPLGAVPGPVNSAASAGCHRLIREYGAALVTNSREACELLGFDDPLGDRLDLSGIDDGGEARESALHRRVLDALPLRGGLDAVEIARRAGLDPGEVRGALAELELLQRVRRRDSPGAGTPEWMLRRRE
ncbi:MAG: DNA-processing protein DprA [Leucobacter sp.]